MRFCVCGCLPWRGGGFGIIRGVVIETKTQGESKNERWAYLLAGPTASGKSAIAAELAREMGAWILSADSMLVYRGMDIGTAKPPPEEIAEFHMGGVDLVTPAEEFSSGAWLRAAAEWASAVPADVPIVIVGGTGLYFSALARVSGHTHRPGRSARPDRRASGRHVHGRPRGGEATPSGGVSGMVAHRRAGDRIPRRGRQGEDTDAHLPACEEAGHLVPASGDAALRRAHCRRGPRLLEQAWPVAGQVWCFIRRLVHSGSV